MQRNHLFHCQIFLQLPRFFFFQVLYPKNYPWQEIEFVRRHPPRILISDYCYMYSVMDTQTYYASLGKLFLHWFTVLTGLYQQSKSPLKEVSTVAGPRCWAALPEPHLLKYVVIFEKCLSSMPNTIPSYICHHPFKLSFLSIYSITLKCWNMTISDPVPQQHMLKCPSPHNPHVELIMNALVRLFTLVLTRYAFSHLKTVVMFTRIYICFITGGLSGDYMYFNW